MTHILSQLFGTYGENILNAHDLYDENEIMAALEQLPLDNADKITVCDLFSEHYLRWSAAAFAVGLHLGLSLLGELPRKP